MLMSTVTMRMAMGKFFSASITHIEHFNFKIQCSTSQWMVSIHIEVLKAGLYYRYIARPLISFDLHDHTRLVIYFFICGTDHMLDRYSLHCIFPPQTVCLIR